MKKEVLKAIFLAIFCVISVKAVIFGFDYAAGLFLIVNGLLVFGYDFISSSKEMDVIRKQVEEIKSLHEETLSQIKNVKSAQNVQKINNTFQSTSNSPFPPRL